MNLISMGYYKYMQMMGTLQTATCTHMYRYMYNEHVLVDSAFIRFIPIICVHNYYIMLSAKTFEGELHVSGQQSKDTDRMLAEPIYVCTVSYIAKTVIKW